MGSPNQEKIEAFNNYIVSLRPAVQPIIKDLGEARAITLSKIIRGWCMYFHEKYKVSLPSLLVSPIGSRLMEAAVRFFSYIFGFKVTYNGIGYIKNRKRFSFELYYLSKKKVFTRKPSATGKEGDALFQLNPAAHFMMYRLMSDVETYQPSRVDTEEKKRDLVRMIYTSLLRFTRERGEPKHAAEYLDFMERDTGKAADYIKALFSAIDTFPKKDLA